MGRKRPPVRRDTVEQIRLSLWRGMAANVLYMLVQVAASIRYITAWSVSVALYYLALSLSRAHVIAACAGDDGGRRCCRRTAYRLLVMNIPMGGMAVLMVHTGSRNYYPGYMIYLSALYAFYAMTAAVVRLVKRRGQGTFIPLAAGALDLAAAMMTMLCLQAALIDRFSEQGESYRRMMNGLTGGAVWCGVLLLAIYLLHRTKQSKEVKGIDKIGE